MSDKIYVSYTSVFSGKEEQVLFDYNIIFAQIFAEDLKKNPLVKNIKIFKEIDLS